MLKEGLRMTTRTKQTHRAGTLSRACGSIVKDRHLWLMILPVLLFYGIFMYAPMFGLQIAFKQYRPGAGVWGSAWIGLKHFRSFFGSYYFERLIRNTLLLNVYDILFGFPAPIILALLLNEVRSNKYKRVVQTITYLPHFISIVVLCGMIVDFLSLRGWVNSLISAFGAQPVFFLEEAGSFRTIYVASGIWQEVGWGSIIYLSALSSVDAELYEAASIDGAGRWKKLWHITLPGILSTIIIMLLLRLGRIMSVGAEKILLLYSPATYETADVISSFVYRKGLLEADYSYASAVGMFNSLINFTFLLIVNRVSKRSSGVALW